MIEGEVYFVLVPSMRGGYKPEKWNGQQGIGRTPDYPRWKLPPEQQDLTLEELSAIYKPPVKPDETQTANALG